MGQLVRAGDPAGAWIDIFDPSESPFGATRRSIAVGREPRPGAVIDDGSALFFADRASNSAGLLRLADATDTTTVPVGQSPEAALVMANERYGITLNSQARTATVVDIPRMERTATLMLAGSPRAGATDADGTALFVSLGGTAWPPTGTGIAVIAGDPPKVVASFDTDKGASRVVSTTDGSMAAVASYWGKSITLVQRARDDDDATVK
jgi:DNA-binding beta-propeller fold protein YncE